MAKFQCSKCPRVFDKKQGLRMHDVRAHSKLRKSWGSATKQSAQTKSAPQNIRGSVKEKLKRVLADHPEGLQVKHIVAGMKKIGYHPPGDATSYVSQTATTDPDIERVERGIYRLKDNLLNELRSQPEDTSVAVATIAPTKIPNMPKETLQLAIEQLSRSNRALGNLIAANTAAQNAFVREITND